MRTSARGSREMPKGGPPIGRAQRIVIALLACLVVAIAVFNSSQQAPSEQHPNGAANTQQSANAPKTDGVKTDAGKAQSQREKKENSATNPLYEWIAGFLDFKLTDVLIVFFTGVLAVKTAGLFTETAGIRAVADSQQRDFLRSVKATEKAALAAETSAETARTEFISTHRPRIVLREAVTGTFLDGEPVKVFFHLANVGDTSGTIIKSFIKVGIVPRGPVPLLHATVEQHHDLGEIILGPGQMILLSVQSETPKWDKTRFQEKSYLSTGGPVMYRDATIHFYGQFIYKDHGPGHLATNGVPSLSGP